MVRAEVDLMLTRFLTNLKKGKLTNFIALEETALTEAFTCLLEGPTRGK